MAHKDNLHIRFHPSNARHQQAAEYINSVPHKQKTAFITAAIEAYQQLHPYGVDYQELKTIQQITWASYFPNAFSNVKLTAQPKAAITQQRAAPVHSSAPPLVSSAGDKAIEDSIDFYNLTDDED